jgi:hypothetical protein
MSVPIKQRGAPQICKAQFLRIAPVRSIRSIG